MEGITRGRDMRFGPERNSAYWDERSPKGDCPQCGGQCDPAQDCGIHPAGCIFGGLAYGYWMIVDGCPCFHGEE